MNAVTWIHTGKISIIKMSILPKAIYIFNTTPIKSLMALLTEMGKTILKFYTKTKDPQEPKQSGERTKLEV